MADDPEMDRSGRNERGTTVHDIEQHAGYLCATHGFVLIDFCSCPDDDIVSLWTNERDDDRFVRVLNRYRESSAGGATPVFTEGGDRVPEPEAEQVRRLAVALDIWNLINQHADQLTGTDANVVRAWIDCTIRPALFDDEPSAGGISDG